MRFQKILNRLTGVSCPIFGVSWNPPESERSTARRVIAYLEDRRVLYVPSEMETPEHCVDSVIRIREFLTSEITKLDSSRELAETLRALRAACRRSLQTIEAGDRGIIRFGGHLNHWASWIFNGALGELRGVFGLHIAKLAAQYGLDVEDDLAAILPGDDDSRETGWA